MMIYGCVKEKSVLVQYHTSASSNIMLASNAEPYMKNIHLVMLMRDVSSKRVAVNQINELEVS